MRSIVKRAGRAGAVAGVIAVGLVLFNGAGHAAGAAGQAGQIREEVTVTLKLLQAYVTAKDGKPVTDLTAADFEVTDNGKVMAVTRYLADGLIKKGYRIVSSLAEAERSGIIAFDSPQFKSQDLFKELLARNVICSVRRDFVRMSPHFYNSFAEMDQVLRLLHDH